MLNRNLMPLSNNFFIKTRQIILKIIEDYNLEGFLITSPANIFYFTGFFYVTNERPVGLYLSKQNKSKLFIPLLEKENAENISVDEICIYEEFPGEIHPLLFMANNINEKKIGCDLNNINLIHLLQKKFEQLIFDTNIQDCRYIKFDEEIELTKVAAHYADICLERLKEVGQQMINNECNEFELVHDCTQFAKDKMKKELDKNFAESPCNVVATIHSGPRGALPHGKSIDRIPRKNETLICGVGACVGGLYAESGITFILGEPNKDQLKIINTMQIVNDETVKNLCEGKTCSAINNEALNIFKKHGYEDFIRHRIGHGMGFEGHEAPWLAPGDETILKKNMIFSNEPGIYRPNIDGYRTISSMIVQKNNGLQISNFLDDSIEKRIINLT